MGRPIGGMKLTVATNSVTKVTKEDELERTAGKSVNNILGEAVIILSSVSIGEQPKATAPVKETTSAMALKRVSTAEPKFESTKMPS
ncbi:hypothetical protein DID80_06170, partial [Candidatus Marinamargulisbacteria bacterium SCGC AAA071-K20]